MEKIKGPKIDKNNLEKEQQRGKIHTTPLQDML